MRCCTSSKGHVCLCTACIKWPFSYQFALQSSAFSAVFVRQMLASMALGRKSLPSFPFWAPKGKEGPTTGLQLAPVPVIQKWAHTHTHSAHYTERGIITFPLPPFSQRLCLRYFIAGEGELRPVIAKVVRPPLWQGQSKAPPSLASHAVPRSMKRNEIHS